ncbi:MAG: DNA cytosine methyltransferase [Thermoanaerobacterales bacterium]|nr:DNA cytosine methyltransferase [Thermoanaerobacterales bacterium]
MELKIIRTSNKPIRLGIVNKGGQGERIYSVKGIAITLSADGGGVFAKTGGYLINGKTRKLHPRECARLMGFLDSYKICKSDNQAYKQFGNSVVIDVLQLDWSGDRKSYGGKHQMKEIEFRQWLSKNNVPKKIQSDLVSRLKRFERAIENCDIDEQYRSDKTFLPVFSLPKQRPK